MQSILHMTRSTAVRQPQHVYRAGRMSIASTYQSRYSHESYGGGDSPRGDRPASRKSRELEHPGPPPPKVSKKTSQTKQEQENQNDQTTSSNHEEEYHQKQPSNKARPTLSTGRESPNIDEQGRVREDVPEDVKRHNREMEHRHDKAYNQIGDEGKVNQGFWKGNGGALTEEKGGARTG